MIDIGILRHTLMERGEWVHSELFSGRIVRVANSCVFKQPVFNDSGDFPWMEFTLRCVVDVKALRSTKDHLDTWILEEFDRAGDRARTPSATMQVVQPPPFEVRLRSPRQDDAHQY